MISLAIVKTLFSGKLGQLFLWSLPVFTTVAVTEAFVGQIIVALIAAIPPTAAVIITLVVLARGQGKMHKSLDGKLTELVQAKTDVARAEGKQEERTEERDRAREDAPAVAAAIANAAAAAVKTDPDQVNKMLIVNKDAEAVPTRPAKPK